jgi:hypothetical protein
MSKDNAERFSGSGGSLLGFFLFWVLAFAWCGGVEVDGVRYDPSCATNPARVRIEKKPVVVEKMP